MNLEKKMKVEKAIISFSTFLLTIEKLLYNINCKIYAPIAELAMHLFSKQEILGSSPSGGIKLF